MWRKLSNERSHPILYIQEIRFHSIIKKSFKKTSVEKCYWRIFAHCCWRKLIRISNKKDLPHSSLQRNKYIWFSRLSSLIDNQTSNESFDLLHLFRTTTTQCCQNYLSVLELSILKLVVSLPELYFFFSKIEE